MKKLKLDVKAVIKKIYQSMINVLAKVKKIEAKVAFDNHYRNIALVLIIISMIIFMTAITSIQWLGWGLTAISTSLWIYDCRLDKDLKHGKYARLKMETLYLIGAILNTITWFIRG